MTYKTQDVATIQHWCELILCRSTSRHKWFWESQLCAGHPESTAHRYRGDGEEPAPKGNEQAPSRRHGQLATEGPWLGNPSGWDQTLVSHGKHSSLPVGTAGVCGLCLVGVMLKCLGQSRSTLLLSSVSHQKPWWIYNTSRFLKMRQQTLSLPER